MENPSTIRRREVFNAGFDAAVRAILSRQGESPENIDGFLVHPRYVTDREHEFQRWQESERRH